jgi:hypothetical protein
VLDPCFARGADEPLPSHGADAGRCVPPRPTLSRHRLTECDVRLPRSDRFGTVQNIDKDLRAAQAQRRYRGAAAPKGFRRSRTGDLASATTELAMRELIVRDDRELRRLNQAIATFGARPDRDRLRMHHLLAALRRARDEIELRAVRAREPARLAEGSALNDGGES